MRPIATDAERCAVCVAARVGTPVSPAKTDERIEMPLGMQTGMMGVHLANTTE